MKRIRTLHKTSEKSINDNLNVFEILVQSCDVILIKSCEEIEGKYFDYLSFRARRRYIVSVGSLVQDINVDDDEQNTIIQWLNKKDQSSSMYVSFGSEYFLSEEEMAEIAQGLDHSSMNFVRVIRFPVGEKKEIKEAVPKEFLQRTRERDGGGRVGSTGQDFRAFECRRVCESLWVELNNGKHEAWRAYCSHANAI